MSTSSLLSLVVNLFAGIHAASVMQTFDESGCTTLDMTYEGNGDICSGACTEVTGKSATKGGIGKLHIDGPPNKNGKNEIYLFSKTACEYDSQGFGMDASFTFGPGEFDKLMKGECVKTTLYHLPDFKKETQYMKITGDCGTSSAGGSGSSSASSGGSSSSTSSGTTTAPGEADNAKSTAEFGRLLVVLFIMHVAFLRGN